MARFTALILLLTLCSCKTEPEMPFLREIHYHPFDYYGDKVKYKKPAEIVALEVFQRIPQYKRIINENLSHLDSEYHFLLDKTCKIFYNAIEHLANQKQLDLIIEKGKVTLTIPAEDITKEAIMFVESK